MDNAQLETLQGFRKALDDGKTGMSAKNKKRLRQFDDSQNVRDLVTLPADLADKVRKEVKGNHGVVTQAAALRFQTAFGDRAAANDPDAPRQPHPLECRQAPRPPP